jgi:uncharacterized protein YdaU (DUF1376 family)
VKAPAFQFYPDQWLASQRVQMMTLEEEGAYIRLLGFCWKHGSIPADPEQAARLIGKGASATLATVVLSMFLPGDAGRLIHDRLEHERIKQAAWREKSAAGGRKSGAVRSKGGSRVVKPPYEPKGNIPSSVSGLQSPSPIATLTTDKTVGRTGAPDDEAWLLSLASDPAYQGMSVETEIAKCRRWCETNRKLASRRRIVNWLNRAERPIGGANGHTNRHQRPAPTAEDHAKGF